MQNLFLVPMLLVAPTKFVEVATEDVINKEFESNKELLSQYPDKKLPSSKRTELYEQMKEPSLKLRLSIINSFGNAFLPLLIAIAAAYVVRFFFPGFVISSQIINFLRILSIGLLFWSFWGKVGWEIQTAGGNTLPEVINQSWAKYLYWTGIFVAMFTYFI